MSLVTLNIKIDSKIKQELKDFAAELGVPMSSLVNGAIKQILRNRKVTFDLNPSYDEAATRLNNLVEK